MTAEERERFGHGQLEHVGDRLLFHDNLEHLVAEALAVAVGTAEVHVRQELHLDVLETVAAAGRAAPVAGVEAEGAGRVPALFRERLFRVNVADRVPGADVARGIRARRAPDRRLVDHDHVPDQRVAAQLAERPRRFGRLALRLSQRGVEHVLHQRGFPRPRDAGDAHQPLERNADVDAFQVVLGRAEELQNRGQTTFSRKNVVCPRFCGAFPPREIFRRERFRLLQLVGRAEENDLAAALAGARAHVHDAVGLQHDLRVVLDHNERISGIPQALHHADDAAHVARVQADRGFVQHEKRIDERGPERGGEIDALHFAAGERARLAVEREIAQAYFMDVAQPRADFGQKEIGGLVQRGGEMQLLEERSRAPGGQEHEVVHGEARERAQHVVGKSRTLRHKAPRRVEHAVRILLGPDSPEQRLGLEARAAAGRTRRVGAVARQEHAHVHFVGLGLQPSEETRDAVPHARPGFSPAHPLGLALEHPCALLRGEIAKRNVERHAAFPGVLLDIVLALVKAGGLPGADRAFAQGFRLVRDDQAVVDADHAPEAAAGLAGAERRVEREQARQRL